MLSQKVASSDTDRAHIFSVMLRLYGIESVDSSSETLLVCSSLGQFMGLLFVKKKKHKKTPHTDTDMKIYHCHCMGVYP